MSMGSTKPPPAAAGAGQIGLAAAVSIGIGGMVGAGIFSILGVVAQASHNAMWLAFAIGGVVALLSTYSYAKLGATFPPPAARCIFWSRASATACSPAAS